MHVLDEAHGNVFNNNALALFPPGGKDRADTAGRAFALANNGTINQLSDAELARWKETIEFMNADWIAKADAAGLDGAALLVDLRETMAKYAAQ